MSDSSPFLFSEGKYRFSKICNLCLILHVLYESRGPLRLATLKLWFPFTNFSNFSESKDRIVFFRPWKGRKLIQKRELNFTKRFRGVKTLSNSFILVPCEERIIHSARFIRISGRIIDRMAMIWEYWIGSDFSNLLVAIQCIWLVLLLKV